MNKLILHIPHSSTQIPMMEGYLVDADFLQSEMLKLTDWYTDDLFHSESDISVIAPFSRIFCDPERFSDDEQEVMSKVGMGVLYEKSDAGAEMRKVSPELREQILSKYYWPHHRALKMAVERTLEQDGSALILDCHSYPSMPLIRDLSQKGDRPDFNIGTDAYHTPQELIDFSVEFFRKKGYSLGVDWPYRGSIVPMDYYQKDKRVQTLMLEINRNLYLLESGNQKSERFGEVKALVKEFMEGLKGRG